MLGGPARKDGPGESEGGHVGWSSRSCGYLGQRCHGWGSVNDAGDVSHLVSVLARVDFHECCWLHVVGMYV